MPETNIIFGNVSCWGRWRLVLLDADDVAVGPWRRPNLWLHSCQS